MAGLVALTEQLTPILELTIRCYSPAICGILLLHGSAGVEIQSSLFYSNPDLHKNQSSHTCQGKPETNLDVPLPLSSLIRPPSSLAYAMFPLTMPGIAHPLSCPLPLCAAAWLVLAWPAPSPHSHWGMLQQPSPTQFPQWAPYPWLSCKLLGVKQENKEP